MAYYWTEDRVRWYLDASARTAFHRRLAAELLPFLNEGDQVADLGCGLGQLDLILAPSVAHITCVDRDGQVLARLEEQARALDIRNLTVCCQDAGALQERFDAAILCFFGTPPSLMLRCARLARRTLIRVVNVHPSPSHLAAGARRETAEEVAAALEQAGLPFRLFRRRLRFDQPLASREEAARFLRSHHPDLPPGRLNRLLEENLQPTGDPDFPLCLPKEKDLGIFVVDTGRFF